MKAMPDLSSGACAGMDTDLFFGQLNKEVEAACWGCPVWGQCFDHAILMDVHGIWAGTTRQMRQSIRETVGITPDPVGGDEFIGYIRPQRDYVSEWVTSD